MSIVTLIVACIISVITVVVCEVLNKKKGNRRDE